jgi:tetratricopeptide (TPR) repeat protein
MKLAHNFSVVLFGSAIAATLVQSQTICATTNTTQIATIARQVTVQIDGQNPGSGVIVAKKGQTYYVLTSSHVVATQDEYEIITPDGQKHSLDYKLVRKFSNVDLALVEFTSPSIYQVVVMGSSRQLKEDTSIYISGFPKGQGDSIDTAYQFSEGELGAIATRPIGQGYALAYLNDTFAGMSGGPILNPQGQLVGIHGASKARFTENQGIDPESGLKYGLNLGIPIDTFLRLVPKVNPALAFPAAAPMVVSPQLTASDLVIQAADQLIADKPTEALTIIEQAIRLQPNYASAYLARGLFRHESNDFRSAIADFDKVISLNPSSGFGYYYRGNAHLVLKNYRGAIADYDQAIRLNPNFAPSYYARGLARAQSQNYRSAIADYDQAIRLNPYLLIAYYNRANAHVQMGNKQEAIADMDKMMRLQSNNSLAYIHRSMIRLQLGDKRGAMADYDQAIRINPNNANIYNHRGFVRASFRDYQGAITDYDQAIRLNPNFAIAYINRGAVRRELKDYQGAIAEFDQAIRLNPNYAIAYNNRGYTRFNLKDYPGAIADYDQAIRLNPNYTLAHNNRAFARFKFGDKQGAISDFQRVAELAKAQGNQQLYNAAVRNINAVQSGATDCYIATASLQTGGSEAQLNLLRGWRDQVLKQTTFGQGLADYYKHIAPLVASKVGSSVWLRNSFLFPFVIPAIWLTQKRISHPKLSLIYDIWLYAILLLMLTYSSACYGFLRLVALNSIVMCMDYCSGDDLSSPSR